VSPFLRPAAVRRADRYVALSVFLVLLALYTATMATQPDVLDGEVEFQTTSSLARNQSLALGGTPEAEAVVAAGFNGRAGGPGREGEFFSWFGVGQAFVGFPFYLVGAGLGALFPSYDVANSLSTHMGVERSEYFEHVLVGWRNPVLAALTAFLIVLSSRRLGVCRRGAWLTGITYGLCTFAWPQARSTLNGVQATFFLFLAFHLVLAIEEALSRHQRPSRSALMGIGLAMGGAFLTRSLVAPCLVVLGIAAAVVLWRGRTRSREQPSILDLGWILVPALACFALFLWTNELRFGAPFEQGYAGVVTWESYFNYPLHLGLAGILLAPGQGLLWMAPGCILGALWFAHLFLRGDRRLPLVVLGMAAAVLVPVCMTVGWHGAWGYGPRYALPLLPFLWLGVGPVLDLVERGAARWLVHGLLVLGLATSLPGVLVDSTTHTALAVEAARVEWPEVAGASEADREEERFQRIRWDLRFAAPWAHWRILRHRVAGLGEEFPARRIFFMEPADAESEELVLTPPNERDRGFHHFLWIDFRDRLGGPLWPVLVFLLVLLSGGGIAALRGLDPDAP
jgi:hypothetical protein